MRDAFGSFASFGSGEVEVVEVVAAFLNGWVVRFRSCFEGARGLDFRRVYLVVTLVCTY